MNPVTAAAIAQGLAAIIEIWRQNANKPKDWTPTAEDVTAMLTLNDKTADDYKAEAAKLLGIPWPPPPESP